MTGASMPVLDRLFPDLHTEVWRAEALGSQSVGEILEQRVDLLTEQLTKAKPDLAIPAGSPILSASVGDFADGVQSGWPSG
jgi:hypothetical protein